MFSVTVRDHLMVAHSLRGEVFGPAQRLHGATFVVDATFRSEVLSEFGIVVDIGLASSVLRDVVGRLSYSNLDEHPEFSATNTTTEVLARWIADQLADAIAAGDMGDAAGSVREIRVTLHESHIASAGYERAL